MIVFKIMVKVIFKKYFCLKIYQNNIFFNFYFYTITLKQSKKLYKKN